MLRASASAGVNHARVILHIDLDCFYCQVEQRRLGIARERPCAVQQWEGLIAVNYAARAAGITRHMRVQEARRACPELTCIHVETLGGGPSDEAEVDPKNKDRSLEKACLERYRRASAEIIAVLHELMPQTIIEKASIDEVYMDVTSAVDKELQERAAADGCGEGSGGKGPSAGAHPTGLDAFAWGGIVLEGPLRVDNEFERRLSVGAAIACRLRGAVRERLQFTCSAGIACNKLLAKLSSGMNKPNQQTIVPPRAVPGLLGPLPLRKLPNFGGKLGAEVEGLGCRTVGDVAALPRATLDAKFGPDRAASIHAAAHGLSDDPVKARELPKSMLAAKSFEATGDLGAVERWLGILAQELSERLAIDHLAHARRPRSLTLYHRAEDRGRGNVGDRSKTGPFPGAARGGPAARHIAEAGAALFRKIQSDALPCTRIALAASDFAPAAVVDGQASLSRMFASAAARPAAGGKGGPAAGESAQTAASATQPAAPSDRKTIAGLFRRASAASAFGAAPDAAQTAAPGEGPPGPETAPAQRSNIGLQDGPAATDSCSGDCEQGRQDIVVPSGKCTQSVAVRAGVPDASMLGARPPSATEALERSTPRPAQWPPDLSPEMPAGQYQMDNEAAQHQQPGGSALGHSVTAGRVDEEGGAAADIACPAAGPESASREATQMPGKRVRVCLPAFSTVRRARAVVASGASPGPQAASQANHGKRQQTDPSSLSPEAPPCMADRDARHSVPPPSSPAAAASPQAALGGKDYLEQQHSYSHPADILDKPSAQPVHVRRGAAAACEAVVPEQDAGEGLGAALTPGQPAWVPPASTCAAPAAPKLPDTNGGAKPIGALDAGRGAAKGSAEASGGEMQGAANAGGGEAQGASGSGGAAAPEVDLGGVDLAEQRRIMREIWVRNSCGAGMGTSPGAKRAPATPPAAPPGKRARAGAQRPRQLSISAMLGGRRS